ncbi:MAG: hypothetical protein A2V81_04595 [Candidatus Abawacabacteria bacterium RBG_16_42_10]|uniref:Pantothenate kinase n=1 Tax=Candidatus Abawacabacteria bacterium RBG_16_42_10 TaxID=1817814 RepID=A0A1F4XJE4_9BACT|nr:MAG: hypothetical protein A2V81_04595 [Candidatus Abawacabacteria bacterium RBG_16_42_10]
MSYSKIMAVDHSWHGNQLAVLEHGQVLKTVYLNRFSITKQGLGRLRSHFDPELLLITGPGTTYLPDKVGDLSLKKEKRLQALLDGVHFLAPTSPSLIIVFETGCHIFYRDVETVYVGCLPYSFASGSLKKNLSLEEEMGHDVGKPLNICMTQALPDFPHSKGEELLLCYSIALALKEFLARYRLNSCYIGGTVTDGALEQLQKFLPGISMKMLDNPSHIAAFGLLLPYIASDL